MPSFARVFQNEIVIKTLYCNKFAIHNTIDIVEVIGSSPTNPTRIKNVQSIRDWAFFHVLQQRRQVKPPCGRRLGCHRLCLAESGVLPIRLLCRRKGLRRCMICVVDEEKAL